MAVVNPSFANGTALVIGYGNALRGDDGVGPVVAEAVAGWGLPGVRALAVPQLAPELAEELASASLVVFVDAWLGSEGGCVRARALGPADHFEALGHTSDPAYLLALTEAVYGRCPRAWIVRVPAVSFEFGSGLSAAASRAAAAALKEVARLVAPGPPSHRTLHAAGPIAMNPDQVFRRYQELQAYIGWTEQAAQLVQAVADMLDPYLPALVDDFYAEIDRHPDARKVITGGQVQIERLKGTLVNWLRELLCGHYGRDYVARRWRVGWRHVEIGLDQVYTNVALSRLRTGLCRTLQEQWRGDPDSLWATMQVLNQLLDLDLAIIEEAYQAEYTARLQRSERLAAIGQMAGGVAHELRNPLNVVKTSVYYLLKARNPTEEKKAEHLTRIEKQVLLADGVITALSNFARMSVPTLVPFSLGPCLQEVLETNPVGENCPVTIDCPASLPPALGDVDQLRIVFGNLVRNAREAMPGGGLLSITARQAGEQIEVAVSDTGVGIAADHLGLVFEPLYSTKARGLGLGLALARSILEKNRGSLRAASELGRGSTFTVLLGAGPEIPNPKSQTEARSGEV